MNKFIIGLISGLVVTLIGGYFLLMFEFFYKNTQKYSEQFLSLEFDVKPFTDKSGCSCYVKINNNMPKFIINNDILQITKIKNLKTNEFLCPDSLFFKDGYANIKNFPVKYGDTIHLSLCFKKIISKNVDVFVFDSISYY